MLMRAANAKKTDLPAFGQRDIALSRVAGRRRAVKHKTHIMGLAAPSFDKPVADRAL